MLFLVYKSVVCFFGFHSAMDPVELWSNTHVFIPCKASCEPAGFYPH